MAEEFDSDTSRRGVTALATEVRRGSGLRFELTLDSLVIADPVQELIWYGETASVQFGVAIPPDHGSGTVIGKVLICQDTVPIGRLLFKLRVVARGAIQTPSDRQPCASGVARRYTLAFISYASCDRPEVLRRVQMLSAVGIRYFQDVLDLDPGDRWARELFLHIDESDVMFLMWSSAAQESEWVRKEWMYGLEKKGDEYIRPVIIEGPPSPAPPPELRHLHFSDRVLYFMHPGARQREQSAAPLPPAPRTGPSEGAR